MESLLRLSSIVRFRRSILVVASGEQWPRVTLQAPSEPDTRHRSYDYFRYEGRDWQFFEPVYARMRPAPPVLDVGSGLGFFVECCQRNGTSVIGLELSKEGVAASASRHLPIVRGDLTQQFPFRDNVFGSALAHHVLEHVSLSQERWIIREVKRVLRPGGLFFAVSPNTFHPQARDEPDHVNLFTPHELGKELRAAGFRNVSLAPNYWRPFRDSGRAVGRARSAAAGIMWKIAPLDRFAASSAALAWK